MADGDLILRDGAGDVDVGDNHFFDFIGIVGAEAEAEERVEL